MIMRPCAHCSANNDCYKQEELRKALKGRGLTSISFICKTRIEHLAPGTRVRATFEITEDHGCYDDGSPRTCETEIELRGTVIRHRDFKVVVWFDEPIQQNRKTTIAKLWPNRLNRILNEPLKELCPECGCPEGEANFDKWSCWKCEGRSSPFEGLKFLD